MKPQKKLFLDETTEMQERMKGSREFKCMGKYKWLWILSSKKYCPDYFKEYVEFKHMRITRQKVERTKGK